MLSNAYFLAKFRFDTAENEPAKNLQNFRKMHFSKCIFRKNSFRGRPQVTELGCPAGHREGSSQPAGRFTGGKREAVEEKFLICRLIDHGK